MNLLQISPAVEKICRSSADTGDVEDVNSTADLFLSTAEYGSPSSNNFIRTNFSVNRSYVR